MADGALFALQLVTPERVLVDSLASEVVLRTGEGDTTFLDGHTPLVGTVVPGVVRILDENGETIRAAVHGGFVQVEQHVPEVGSDGAEGTRVTLLAGVAEPAGEIDVERARVARDAAESRVNDLSGGAARAGGEDEAPDLELEEARAALVRAEVRLSAAGEDAAG